MLAVQVSLRGASAKEISRDALLEKVSQERELRNYARRANAAALLIQVPFPLFEPIISYFIFHKFRLHRNNICCQINDSFSFFTAEVYF